MLAPILIFAVGNMSRGDDALAPALLRRLEACLHSEGRSGEFELIEDFQLQIEHATDMTGRKMILFIDAGQGTPDPFVFYRVTASGSPVLYSHTLAPEALLDVYLQIYHEAPPPAFVLCIRGEQFELGLALSAEAESRLEAAMEFVLGLVKNTEISWWEAQQPHPARLVSDI